MFKLLNGRKQKRQLINEGKGRGISLGERRSVGENRIPAKGKRVSSLPNQPFSGQYVAE